MPEQVKRVGPFAVTGDIAWAFPAGLVLLIGVIACFVALGAFGLYGGVFPCEEEGRLASCFVVGATTSGACLAVAACESVGARVVAGILAAAVFGVLAYSGVAGIFAPHC